MRQGYCCSRQKRLSRFFPGLRAARLQLRWAGRGGGFAGVMATASGQADRFPQAWAAMRHDSSIQFKLAAPPQPAKPPAWLEAIFRWLGKALEPVGRFLRWIGSFFPDAAYARLLLW